MRKHNGGNGKKLFLLPLFLFILSFSAIATGDFLYVGYNDGVTDSGNFNQNLNPSTLVASPATIANPLLQPLVGDLDNDGRNEIVVQDGLTTKIYQNTTLNALLGHTHPFTNISSNMLLFDIDGDGTKEVIIGGYNGTGNFIRILELNSTGFVLKKEHAVPRSSTGTEMTLACASAHSCAVAWVNIKTITGNQNIYTAGFDETTFTDNSNIALRNTLPTATFCFPQIKAMDTGDYDSDGLTDYVLSVIEYGTGSERARLLWFDANNSIQTQHHKNATSVLYDIRDPVAGDTCNAAGVYVGNHLSPPLMFDADQFYSGLETIIATQQSSTKYNMLIYDSSRNNYDEYPDAAFIGGDTPGVLLSNVFRADALKKDGQKDFCVLGDALAGSPGSGGQSEINILCGTSSGSGHSAYCATGQCQHAEFDGQVVYNISVNPFSSHIFASSTRQSSSDTQNSIINGGSGTSNLDEVSSSYGIFRLTYTDTDNTADLIFAQPKDDGSVLMTDYTKVGLADMLVMTDTNLFYIDDGFNPTGAKITGIQKSPCPDAVIQENTTIAIAVTVNDEETSQNLETNSVSCQVIGYYGHPNQQTSPWSANVSANGCNPCPTIPFSFVANQTIPSGTIRVTCIDTGQPTDIDSVDIPFSVATTGAVSGSCSQSFALTDVATATAASNVSRLPRANNTISNAVAGINEQFGLGSTTLWLIFMVVIAVGLWITGHESHGGSLIVAGVIGFVEFLLFIIGAYLGFISAGLIVILVIIAVAIIGFMFIRPIIGGGGT